MSESEIGRACDALTEALRGWVARHVQRCPVGGWIGIEVEEDEGTERLREIGLERTANGWQLLLATGDDGTDVEDWARTSVDSVGVRLRAEIVQRWLPALDEHLNAERERLRAEVRAAIEIVTQLLEES